MLACTVFFPAEDQLMPLVLISSDDVVGFALFECFFSEYLAHALTEWY